MKNQSKILKGSLKAITAMACAFLFVMVNTTCIGPGYQPQLPQTLDKFRLK